MDELISRFPQIAGEILENLDNKSLVELKYCSRSGCNFIENQKFLWVRILQKHVEKANKEFSQNPVFWRKMFQKVELKNVKKIVKNVHAILKMKKVSLADDITPLHFILEENAPLKRQERLEIFKNIFDVMINRFPEDKFWLQLLFMVTEDQIFHLMLQYMIENPVIKDKYIMNGYAKCGQTLLHIAATEGNFDGFVHLSKVYPNINPGNMILETPLHFAAQNGHFKICKYIIHKLSEKGEETNPISSGDMTPLHVAALFGRFKICQFMIPRVSNIDCLEEASEMARQNGFRNVAKLFKIGNSGKGIKLNVITNKTK